MIDSYLVDIFTSIISITLGMARLFPCLILAPVFSFTMLKGMQMVRNGITLSLSLFVYPTIEDRIKIISSSPWYIVGIAFKEVIVGILLGCLLALPFWLFQCVGALFDSQRGALNAGQLNPDLGPDATPIGDMLFRWSTIIMIMYFSFSPVTQVIWDSYQLLPVNDWLPELSEKNFHVFFENINKMFIDMVLYAGPIVLILLLVEFAVGIISIYCPQLQSSSLSMPLKGIVGIVFFVLYLSILEFYAKGQFEGLKRIIPNLHNVL